MAGVIGGAGGYATVAPTRNYIGEAMTNVQDTLFKQKAQRQADEKAQREQQNSIQEILDKQLAKDQALFEKHPEGKDLGIEQPDVLLHNNVLDNREQYKKAGEILSNPNATSQQRSQAFGVQQNALSSIDKAADFKAKLGSTIDAARENKGGIYNPQGVKEVLENSQKFSTGQWRLDKDEKGNTRVNTFDVDENGKFTKATGVGLSFQELLDKYTPPLNYSLEDNNVEFKKGLKEKSQWTDPETGRIREGYQGIEQLAENNANSVITNRDKMYGVASAAGVKPQLDLKDYTPTEIKKVKDFISQSILEGYKPSDKRDYQSEQLAISKQSKEDAQRNADRSFKQAQDKKGEESRNITVTKETGGVFPTTRVTRKMTQAELDAENAKEFSNVRKTGSGITIGKKGNDWYNTETKEKITIKEAKNAVNSNKTSQSSYTNVTETDKGTIGVKNGKWYYTKTGKIAQ